MEEEAVSPSAVEPPIQSPVLVTEAAPANVSLNTTQKTRGNSNKNALGVVILVCVVCGVMSLAVCVKFLKADTKRRSPDPSVLPRISIEPCVPEEPSAPPAPQSPTVPMTVPDEVA